MSIYPGAYTYYWNTRATAPRRIRPNILAAIHITGNSALPSAVAEAKYANRVGSGASFTFVTNRNGTVVQCLQPETQVPFTNGSWRGQNMGLSTVAYDSTHGIGANDSTFLTIENVGFEWSYPITAAQIEAIAKIVAWGSKRSGLPINRTTVLGHRDYNSVTRYYCPTGGSLNTLLNKIIARAQQINAGSAPPAPAPSTDTKVGGLPVKFTNRSGWRSTIKPYKPRRSGASLASPNYGNTDSNGEVIPIWGEVVGQDWGAGPRWFFAPQYIGGWKVVYIPLIDLTNRNF